MQDIDEMRKELVEKLDYVEKLIGELEDLKNTWEERIAEAEQAKTNFKEMIKYFKEET